MSSPCTSERAAPYPDWPLFDLRIRTRRLELRVPTDDDLAELVVVARRGVHRPGERPFRTGWAELPSPRFEHAFAQYFWTLRAEWRPERWRLPLGAFTHEGEPVGVQQIGSQHFPVRRTIRSATWVGLALQDRGYGTEMRAGALALAFDVLGARYAEAGTNADNLAAQGMLRRLGYVDNGAGLELADGSLEPVPTRYFRLDAPAWAAHRPDGIEVDDVPLALFGLA
jgi:RimJ/RimL family protein N-acetyltransferase